MVQGVAGYAEAFAQGVQRAVDVHLHLEGFGQFMQRETARGGRIDAATLAGKQRTVLVDDVFRGGDLPVLIDGGQVV